MKQHLPLYGLAAAILIVGVVAFGLPVSSLFLLAVVLACPLMMMFMMRDMHGGDGNNAGSQDQDRDRGSRLGH